MNDFCENRKIGWCEQGVQTCGSADVFVAAMGLRPGRFHLPAQALDVGHPSVGCSCSSFLLWDSSRITCYKNLNSKRVRRGGKSACGVNSVHVSVLSKLNCSALVVSAPMQTGTAHLHSIGSPECTVEREVVGAAHGSCPRAVLGRCSDCRDGSKCCAWSVYLTGSPGSSWTCILNKYPSIFINTCFSVSSKPF